MPLFIFSSPAPQSPKDYFSQSGLTTSLNIAMVYFYYRAIKNELIFPFLPSRVSALYSHQSVYKIMWVVWIFFFNGSFKLQLWKSGFPIVSSITVISPNLWGKTTFLLRPMSRCLVDFLLDFLSFPLSAGETGMDWIECA